MTGQGFSVELDSGAATVINGLPVVCACMHGGRVVGSDGVALYRVGGDTDDGAPIAARLTTPPLPAPGPSRLRAVAFDGAAKGRLDVTAVSDAGAEALGEIGPAGRDGLPGRASCRLGRGLGRVWSLTLAADDGEPFDVTALEARFVGLDRRD